MELTKGVFKAAENIFQNNKGSILRTIIYTIGHMIIAIVCVMAITGATLELALADAFIEPIINGVWFFILHTGYQKYIQTKQVKA